ncbi:EAL domain-containing protein [Legionella quateirensis]|uniref:Inner membrane protein PLUS sensory box protein LssE n=1 Tax=Legionella quateirensis TaxID=45072 RepID=A0A378KQP5_9GAMM|nr:EAL domain-containing protein [Legionella quateirensis]KTD54723.1 inner membrane protein/sensory box protein LssE [Legionella quateirensis]STY16903.1 inner membrane protein PLUS sensory box protein LssE [Legionella quateirensis]
MMMNTHIQVLVVEDNPAFIRLIEELLKEFKPSQFELIPSDSIASATSILKEQNVDVILLDLGLPDCSGIDTYRKINNFAFNIPIIILSGLQDENVALATIAEGAQDYFIKGTFDGNLLARAILYALERKHNELMISDYTSIIENTNESIISINNDGLIRNLNHAAQQLFQYSEQEAIGQSVYILVPEEHKYLMQQMLHHTQSGGFVTEHEFILINKNGVHICCFINASPIKDKMDAIIGTAIMALDFTIRKQIDLRSAIQLRVATILAEMNNLQNVAHNILKTICELLDFQVGEIWALDIKNDELIHAASWCTHNMPSEFTKVSHELSFLRGEGIPGYVWETKRTYWLNDLSKSDKVARRILLEHNGLTSALGIPILFGEDVLGVLLFFGHHLTQPDVPMMILFEIIGKQIGTFLKRKRMEDELVHLARYDILTGLVNKATMDSALNHAIDEAKINRKLVAFLYIDLDYFKSINDILGHPKGDQVLQEVAHRLQSVVRETDLISRFGGDEFVIMIPQIQSKAQISHIAQKILDIIALPYVIDQKEFYLSASIGISLYPDNGKDAATLYVAADLALYTVKQSTRNGYQYASKILGKKAQQKMMLENQLHTALKNNEFILYYQPIVTIQSNKIESVEALVRWKKPNGRILLPTEFISLLERSDLILSIGEWVLRTACEQIKLWEHAGIHYVSVNVSIHQLNNNFIKMVINILNETGINPRNLIIEITESMLMQEKLMFRIINSLGDLGVLTSIDDFGTGYSAFSYLQTFNFDTLKIDKSFIDKINKDKTSNSIVKAIVAMTKILNLKTIAEGVETREQLEFLKEIGCDMYQGFYFSKPLPPEQLNKLLKKNNK